MDEKTLRTMGRPFPSVSPYLMRPLRSHEQALADIAAAKSRANTVTPFVPLVVVTGTGKSVRSGIVSKSYQAA